MKKINLKIRKLAKFFVSWDKEHYNKHITTVGIIGGSLHLIFLLKTFLGYGFNGYISLRIASIIALYSLLLLPKNLKDYKFKHKCHFEIALIIALPILFSSKVMINIGSGYHMAAMILCGVIYGLLAQPLVGLLAMASASVVAVSYYSNIAPEHYKVALSMHAMSITGYIISLSLQASRNAAMKQIAKQKAYKSKFESLGQMAGGICHEINNPIMGVSGNLQIAKFKLQGKEIDKDDIERTIDKSMQNLNRISDIVKNLQIFSHDFLTPQKDKKNLLSVVDSIQKKYLFELNSDKISLEIDSKSKEILSRYKESEFVILTSIDNLVKNSIEALNLDDKEENKRICIEVKQDKSNILISVIDNGVGIPPENLEKIADPFFSTKRQGEGMGLGLSVVKGLVEGINGQFFVDEDSNHTKITLMLNSPLSSKVKLDENAQAVEEKLLRSNVTA